MKSRTQGKRNNSGFTLIEMLVCIAILVILIAAMSSGMSTAMRVYKESVFYSNSATLSYITNTALEDVLRYSESIYIKQGNDFVYDGKVIAGTVVGSSNTTFLFTNYEYSAQNAYFELKTVTDSQGSRQVIQTVNTSNGKTRELVNTGAYPKLSINNLQITPDPSDSSKFTYSYEIYSVDDASMTYSPGSQYIYLLNEN